MDCSSVIWLLVVLFVVAFFLIAYFLIAGSIRRERNDITQAWLSIAQKNNKLPCQDEASSVKLLNCYINNKYKKGAKPSEIIASIFGGQDPNEDDNKLAINCLKSECGISPAKYKCNTTNNSYECIIDPDGEYSSIDDCTKACFKSQDHYTCDTSNYTCKIDPSGTETQDSCSRSCINPKDRYVCDTSDYTCKQSDTGTQTKDSCNKSCIKP